MRRERGGVSVGDAVRALRALNLPRSALPDVAELLGLATPRRLVRAPEQPPLPPRERAPLAAPVTLRAPRVVEAPREPPLPETSPAARRPTELIAHPPLADARFPPRAVHPLAELVPPAPGRPSRPASLLEPTLERAILGALVASRRPDGDPDVEALVPRIAAGEPVRTIPRRPLRTTRLGVRLLVDAGGGMLPFRHDAERLAERIAQLVGAAGVERFDFDGSPLGPHGLGDGPVWDWVPYHALRPLAPGRPVLALTDLGLGGRSPAPAQAARAWLAFAELVESPLVLLVPYPRTRWPAVRGLHVVPWDRATSVREALR